MAGRVWWLVPPLALLASRARAHAEAHAGYVQGVQGAAGEATQPWRGPLVRAQPMNWPGVALWLVGMLALIAVLFRWGRR
jgi:hypothetical protein